MLTPPDDTLDPDFPTLPAIGGLSLSIESRKMGQRSAAFSLARAGRLGHSAPEGHDVIGGAVFDG